MEVKETATELKINLVGDILFDFDKADIRSAAEPTLTQVVAMIQKYPNANVLIEGHTDSKGNQPYNAKLSEKRAASVKTYLVGKGIAEASIWTRGWGPRSRSRKTAVRTGPITPTAGKKIAASRSRSKSKGV